MAPHTGVDQDADAATDKVDSEELTPRQEKLLSALVADPEITAAAKSAGVGRSSAHRWLRQPSFKAELAQQRDAAMTEALDTFKSHAARATTALADLMSTDNERLRRQICNDILGHALKVRELEDIERRLTLLEKTMQNNNHRK
jgi:phage terminase small subunit